MLPSKNICGINIFRPCENIEKIIYRYVKSNVFKKFKSGKYTEKKIILEIVSCIYNIHYRVISKYINYVDKYALFIFLSNEYERYAQAVEHYNNSDFSTEEEDLWKSYAGNARRAIKHLMELIIIEGLYNRNNVPLLSQEKAVSKIFISAEEMVGSYMRYQLYDNILESVTLTLDENRHEYFHVAEDLTERYDPREDICDMKKCIPSPSFFENMEKHNQIIGKSFEEKFGKCYLGIMYYLRGAIDIYYKEQGDFCIIKRSDFIDFMSKGMSISKDSATTIIEGFSLNKHNMLNEGRVLSKPKQEYRAYKRGFFVTNIDGEDYLLFSPRMAIECWNILRTDVCFGKIPPEWKSKKIEKDIATLSGEAGKWFENVVKAKFEEYGFIVFSSLKRMAFRDGRSVKLEDGIGEIDLLCYDRKNSDVVVVEVKQVSSSSEPRQYLDDISRFITSKNNYRNKFIKKYTWFINNKELLKEYLSEKIGGEVEIKRIGYAIITRYPSPIFNKIKDFSCISIMKFVREFSESKKWSFSSWNSNN